MVDQDTGGQEARPEDAPEDVTRVIHELAEGLTAAGNFVLAAAAISDGSNPPVTDIRKVLRQAADQHDRAARALQQLRKLLMDRKP